MDHCTAKPVTSKGGQRETENGETLDTVCVRARVCAREVCVFVCMRYLE